MKSDHLHQHMTLMYCNMNECWMIIIVCTEEQDLCSQQLSTNTSTLDLDTEFAFAVCVARNSAQTKHCFAGKRTQTMTSQSASLLTDRKCTDSNLKTSSKLLQDGFECASSCIINLLSCCCLIFKYFVYIIQLASESRKHKMVTRRS